MPLVGKTLALRGDANLTVLGGPTTTGGPFPLSLLASFWPLLRLFASVVSVCVNLPVNPCISRSVQKCLSP